jgi:UDP-N-acetylmuramate--alanine ligase
MIDAPAQRLDGFARGLADEFAGDEEEPLPVLLGRIAEADASGTTVELYSRALLGEPRTIRLATAGRHNAANALGVIAAARVLDVPTDPALDGLASFEGVGRRLERKGEAAGVAVYDDYGHHPTAIRETIAALRQREPDHRLWAVYEPLTFHRTAAMLDAFADVLSTADAVAIADIWAGRDPDTTVASAVGLAEAVAARRPDITVAAPGSVEATAAWLAGEVRSGDAVLVMGGGRSYRIGELLLEHLGSRSGR